MNREEEKIFLDYKSLLSVFEKSFEEINNKMMVVSSQLSKNIKEIKEIEEPEKKEEEPEKKEESKKHIVDHNKVAILKNQIIECEKLLGSLKSSASLKKVEIDKYKTELYKYNIKSISQLFINIINYIENKKVFDFDIFTIIDVEAYESRLLCNKREEITKEDEKNIDIKISKIRNSTTTYNLIDSFFEKFTKSKEKIINKNDGDYFSSFKEIVKTTLTIEKFAKILNLYYSLTCFEVQQYINKIWVNIISKTYMSQINNCMSKIINNYRDGNAIELKQINEIIQFVNKTDKMFQMNLYTIIKDSLKKESETYFKNKNIKILSIFDYINYVYDNIEKEKYIADILLTTNLVHVLYDVFINSNIDDIVLKITDLLELNLTSFTPSNLNKLYELLLYNNNDLQKVSDKFCILIKNYGSIVVKDILNKKDVIEKIKNIFNLYNNADYFIRNIFKNNYIMLDSIKKSFEYILNIDVSVAKLLVHILHKSLMKFSSIRDEDKKIIIDNIMNLYTFIINKDVFENEFHILLAQRLLDKSSASDQDENSILNMFKAICGVTAVSKFDGMFQDIESSKKLMQKYENKNNNSNIEFDTIICRLGCWPGEFLERNIIIPTQLTPSVNNFTKFYNSQFPDYLLKFDLLYGNAEINITIDSNVKTILVSTIQMLILLCINDSSEPLTLASILEKTKLDKNNIVDHIMTLIHPDYYILQKNPPSRDLKLDHKFRLSTKWSPKLINLKRIKINLVSFDDLKPSINLSEITNDVLMNRVYLIESSIVRVMKIKKQLNNNDLVSEIQNQLKTRFEINVSMIKNGIDKLIEQDYIERDENNRNIFKYIA